MLSTAGHWRIAIDVAWYRAAGRSIRSASAAGTARTSGGAARLAPPASLVAVVVVDHPGHVALVGFAGPLIASGLVPFGPGWTHIGAWDTADRAIAAVAGIAAVGAGRPRARCTERACLPSGRATRVVRFAFWRRFASRATHQTHPPDKCTRSR